MLLLFPIPAFFMLPLGLIVGLRGLVLVGALMTFVLLYVLTIPMRGPGRGRREADPSLCPRCGYPRVVRGEHQPDAEAVCPECGTRFG